jgi:hypothetical protein
MFRKSQKVKHLPQAFLYRPEVGLIKNKKEKKDHENQQFFKDKLSDCIVFRI